MVYVRDFELLLNSGPLIYRFKESKQYSVNVMQQSMQTVELLMLSGRRHDNTGIRN